MEAVRERVVDRIDLGLCQQRFVRIVTAGKANFAGKALCLRDEGRTPLTKARAMFAVLRMPIRSGDRDDVVMKMGLPGTALAAIASV